MIRPDEIIAQYSIEDLNRTADDYFKGLSDPLPQLGKPFSHLSEAPDMLQNMGLLLSGLQLAKTMTVLEFAAGTCWFSRFLHQLQCRTISCDVSKTALALGAKLFRDYPVIGVPIAEPAFVHFDGHRLDLPDGSVDRIICNDAFHHVANQEDVLGELARVLKPGGIAGFCEPGRYHSQTPQSQYEMKNFTVLENDIVLHEIYAKALRAGFTDLTFKIFEAREISYRKYHNLLSLAEKTRPLWSRAFPRLSNYLSGKNIFFLYKGVPVLDSRSTRGLAHKIKVSCLTPEVKAGQALGVDLEVMNTGSARWLVENIQDIGVVKIGAHLYDHCDRLLDLDFFRHTLAREMSPGDSVDLKLQIPFTTPPGRYRLALDLVAEGVCWFESIGSQPQWVDVDVLEP